MIIPHTRGDPGSERLNNVPKVMQLVNCQARTNARPTAKPPDAHFSFLVPPVALERTHNCRVQAFLKGFVHDIGKVEIESWKEDGSIR